MEGGKLIRFCKMRLKKLEGCSHLNLSFKKLSRVREPVSVIASLDFWANVLEKNDFEMMYF